jgi:hypothetical protein
MNPTSKELQHALDLTKRYEENNETIQSLREEIQRIEGEQDQLNKKIASVLATVTNPVDHGSKTPNRKIEAKFETEVEETVETAGESAIKEAVEAAIEVPNQNPSEGNGEFKPNDIQTHTNKTEVEEPAQIKRPMRRKKIAPAVPLDLSGGDENNEGAKNTESVKNDSTTKNPTTPVVITIPTASGIRKEESVTVTEAVTNLLKKNPEGLSVQTIASETGKSEASLYIWLAAESRKTGLVQKVSPSTYKLRNP